jgi:hypothetical protein
MLRLLAVQHPERVIQVKHKWWVRAIYAVLALYLAFIAGFLINGYLGLL